MILLFSTISNAQTVELQGYFEDVKDSTKISFNNSVDKNYRNFWMDCESAIILNNSFTKYFHFNGTGAFTINSSLCTPRIELIVDEDSKIKMFVKKKEGIYDITFKGDNALGLNELNRSELFKFKTLYPLVENCFIDTKSASDFINKLLILRKELLVNMEDLYSKNEITSLFYERIQNEADLQLLYAANFKIESYKEDLKIKNDLKLSDQDLNEIIVRLDEMYNAFDQKYEKCNGIHRVVVIPQKSLNISRGILKGSKHDIGLWDTHHDYYNYAPLDSQELLLVNNINFLGFEKGGCSFEKFKDKFPKSPYLLRLEKLNNDSNNSAILPYTYATYLTGSEKINIKSTTQYVELSELIKEKFQGKSVFVDLWATYCAPCKKEFAYAADLHNFLNENKIDIIYISVDPKGVEQKLVEDIQSFKLYGNHYFASGDILKSLQKILNEEVIAIPRYLLFNSKGELVIKNTKNPSEQQVLYDEILTALR
ncbi:TlpA family protein disulfide reductase [Flavobacterium shii]|nr:redoxin family protein [Flavobacterium shii]